MPRLSSVPSSRLVLGLDPALRNLGWAIARVDGDRVEPLALGVVVTKPSKDKKATKTRDNFDAATILARALFELVRWTPDGPAPGFCEPRIREARVEAMSYPPGASSAARISLCWGALAAVSARDGLVVRQASPQSIKKKVAGIHTASKDEVRAALEARFGRERIAALLKGIARSRHEHPLDALASIVALPQEIVMGKRKGRRRRRKDAPIARVEKNTLDCVRAGPPDKIEPWEGEPVRVHVTIDGHGAVGRLSRP